MDGSPVPTAPVASVPPHLSRFETIVVDLTHRCNMACHNCYLPNRDIPDMDVDRLEACLAALPQRTNIRLAGAEPTLRRDLPAIIDMVRRTGHRPVLLTNGLRLSRQRYVDALREAGLRHVYISMNGADNDDWYQAIDNLRCADRKVAALRACVNARMILNTGTILYRGVNEGAVARLTKLLDEMAPVHALMRFKNIGALGRYDAAAESRNLRLSDIERLVADVIGVPPAQLSPMRRIKQFTEDNSRLFPAVEGTRPGRGLWFKLTNWQSNDNGQVDAGSFRRGRITQTFQVAPFFEHVKENEGAY